MTRSVSALNLIVNRKLLLVLDLDSTIVHSSPDSRGDFLSEYEVISDNLYKLEFDKCMHPYYLKFRPGLDAFLKSAKEKFELAIYTQGSRIYAERILSIIDSDDSIFKRRVYAKEQVSEAQKNMKAFFENYEPTMTIIIDDRIDVWKQSANVIMIHQFLFWKSLEKDNLITPTESKTKQPNMTSSIFFPSENKVDVDYTEIINVESLTDDVLGSIWSVVSALHAVYYGDEQEEEPVNKSALPMLSSFDPELGMGGRGDESKTAINGTKLCGTNHHLHCPPVSHRDTIHALAAMQMTVLQGVYLLFACKVTDTIKNQLVKFGAQIYEEPTDRLTHIIVTKPEDIAKFQPCSDEIIYVHFDWLTYCMAHFHRAPESKFCLARSKRSNPSRFMSSLLEQSVHQSDLTSITRRVIDECDAKTRSRISKHKRRCETN